MAPEQPESVTLNLATGTWLGGAGPSAQMLKSPAKPVLHDKQVTQAGGVLAAGRSPLSSLLPEKGGHIKIKSVGTVDYTDTKTRRTHGTRHPSSSQLYGSTSIGKGSSNLATDSMAYPGASTPPLHYLQNNNAIIAHN